MSRRPSAGPSAVVRVWADDSPPLPDPDATPTVIRYFGDDRARLDRLRRTVAPPHVLAAVGDAVNAAARRVAEAAVDLDAALLEAAPLGAETRRAAWDAGDLADRSPYVSPLILDAARASVCLDVLRAGGRHLFLCDDAATARLLTATAQRNGLTLGGPPPPSFFRRAAARAAAAAQGTAARLRAAAAALAAARTLRARRRTRPPDRDGLRRADILVVLWTGSATFAALDAGKDDMFFGSLIRDLAAAGRRPAFLALPTDWVEPLTAVIERATASPRPVLFTYDVVTLGAVGRALRVSLRRTTRRDATWRVGDNDLEPATARAADLDFRRGRAFQAALFAEIGEAVVRLGCRPAAVIMPYENQAWEKMLRRGLRRALPDCRIIGVQHAPFPPVYASFFPGRAEIARGLIPDFLATTGDAATAAFIARGFPAERLYGCALRFADLAAAARREPPPDGFRPDGFKVVCATGVGLDEATELAVKAAAAGRRSPGLRLTVNFHPTVDDAFKRTVATAVAADGDDDHVAYSDAPARDLTGGADVLLYNASGAVFDAVAAGRPALFVGRDLALDLDKAQDADGGDGTRDAAAVSRVVRDVDELRAALAAARAAPVPDGRAGLARRFAPADAAALLRAAALDRGGAIPPDDGGKNTARAVSEQTPMTAPPPSAAPRRAVPFRVVAEALKILAWAGSAAWRRRTAATLRAVLDDLGPDGEPLVCADTPRGRLTFYCPNDLTVWRAQTLLTKEPETIAWIDGFAAGDVLWDIGANVGLYSLYAALAGAGRVLAFEPSAANYDILNRNIRRNGMDDRVSALALALSDGRAAGTLDLGDPTAGGALSTFRAAGEAAGEAACPQGVLAYGVDDFVRDFDPPFPNHLKIDVDGLEPRIVAGAARTLADPRLRSVSVELDDARPEVRRQVTDALERAGLVFVCRGHAPMFDDGPFAGLYNYRFERRGDGARS